MNKGVTMSDKTCPHCGKEFSKPWYLGRHLQRKTPCAPILEHEDLPEAAKEDPDLEKKKCKFCGRLFSSYNSMLRHVREACKIAPNKRNGEDGMERLYQHVIQRQQRENADLRRRVQNLEDRFAAGAPLAVQGSTVTNHNNYGVVNNITVNIFRQEATPHIGLREVKRILDGTKCLAADPAGAATQVLMEMAMLIYSDPEHPENLTCFLPNKKTKDALVHAARPDGGTSWEVRPVPLTLSPMAQKSLDVIFRNQPLPGLDGCDGMSDHHEYDYVIKELAHNEERYARGEALQPILIRNKDLLAKALARLPSARDAPQLLPPSEPKPAEEEH